MCIFCEIINGNIPTNKVYEDDYTLAFLDMGQTTYGHTLVVPKKHVDSILECDQETNRHVADTVTYLSSLLVKKLDAKGINIVSNAKEIAGQSVNHYHVHLIPRYSSDDDFSIHFSENKTDLSEVLNKINK